MVCCLNTVSKYGISFQETLMQLSVFNLIAIYTGKKSLSLISQKNLINKKINTVAVK